MADDQELNLWALSGEIGLVLAIPLVLLLLLGIKIDRWLGTTPLFIIAAIILSLGSSTIMIGRKIKRLNHL